MKLICLFLILLLSSGIFGEDDMFRHVLEKANKDEHSDYKKPLNDLTETDIDEIYNHTETMNDIFAEKYPKEVQHTGMEDLTETDINEQNDYKGEEMIHPLHNKRGVTTKTRLWPRKNNVLHIPYKISSKYSSKQKKKILKAISVMNKVMKSCNTNSNVWVSRSKANTNHKNYVDFLPGRGCYSYVGMINRGNQTLSLANGCLRYIGIIYHEMMHAMGFMHEQSRKDRDKYVKINFGNIKAGRERNFKKRGEMRRGSAGSYDCDSVMHYGKKAFSKNGKNTIEPKKKKNIGQRKKMSKKDKMEILSVYNCK